MKSDLSQNHSTASNGPIRLSTVQIIGHEIRRYREARGLSQRRLAELAGTTQASIAHIEGGQANPTLGLVERLAHALGMDLAVVLRKQLGRSDPAKL